MSSIIKKFNHINSDVPIWLMRQAGRYLPEYMQVRKSVSNFLELCYDPSKAAKVTLQPIERFNLDAAIIFSDILVLPHALGWDVKFQENLGPVLKQFSSASDFADLHTEPLSIIDNVYEAISTVRSNLGPERALIGFIGSPWTVVSYMLEGRGKTDFSKSKQFIYQNPDLTKQLIDFITEKSIIHLANQIKAGSNIIQLFDSWSGIISGDEYESLVIEPTKKIVTAIKLQFPDIPIIGFPRGSGLMYEKYITTSKIDAVGVDQFTSVEFMKKWQQSVVVQGNLDPVILLTDQNIIAKKTDNILRNSSKDRFIFNLGHGILPTTPIDNVKFLVNYVKQFRY